MDNFVLTPEIITGISGVILSLAFSYIPKFNVKFASLDSEMKRSIMAGLLLLVTASAFGGQYFGLWNAGFTMDKFGVMQAVWSYVLAIVANQSAFAITPKTSNVKLAVLDSRMASSNNLMIGKDNQG